MALLFFSFLCLLSSHAAPASPSPGWSVATATDELALLSFKSVLSVGPSDSEGLLASWNTSSHHCSWPGVVCGGRRHPERVVALRLGSSNLSGRISPSLGNLSFLRELDLGDNRLVGEIPPELGRLSKLRLLNLSANSLHGSIPVVIGGCTNLMSLDLSINQLRGWLHPDTNDQAEQKHLNLHQRVTILLDVACALDYLHCHGPAPVVHCDVKSSNVLLDADMVAHVGDFGLARILVEGISFLQQSSSSLGFRGTIGYAAPEYGAGNMVSINGDVYSYGILVLETVTGKRPTDSRFRQGLSLRECVEQALHHCMMDVVDARLCLDLENELQTMDDTSSKRKIDGLISLLRLGMSCSQEMPSSRTSTGDIIKELHAIKESLW